MVIACVAARDDELGSISREQTCTILMTPSFSERERKSNIPDQVVGGMGGCISDRSVKIPHPKTWKGNEYDTWYPAIYDKHKETWVRKRNASDEMF